MMIRPIDIINDRESIHEVRKASWKKAYVGLIPDEIIGEATSDQGVSQPPPAWPPTRVGFVALDNNQIIGFVSGGLPRSNIASEDCEIWALYVHPNHQRKKAGKLLLEEFRKTMQDRSMKRLIVWVLKENHSSRKFYESMGGQLQSAEKMFTFNGKDVALEVAYLWKLEG